MQNPIVLYPVSLDEIDERIKNAVMAAISQVALPNNKFNSYSEVLTKPEARKLLGGISTPSFDKLIHEKKFNVYRPTPGRVVFLRSELMKYLLNSKLNVLS
jgi:hypothetical protein